MFRSVLSVALASAFVVASIAGAVPAVATPIADVTSASIATSSSIVYPHKDGYLDTMKIVAKATTDDASVSTAPGTLVITKGSKIVASWRISAAKSTSEVWNGRIKNKGSSGTYVITLRYTNADATTAISTAHVQVSTKKLVRRTWSHTVQAGQVYTECTGLSECQPAMVKKSLPSTRSHGVTHFHFKIYNGLKYIGNGPDSTPSIFAGFALPSGIRTSVKASMFVSAKVQVGGSKGHVFKLQTCGRTLTMNAPGPCGAIRTVTKTASVNTSKVPFSQNTTAYAVWRVGVGSTGGFAVVGVYTVHVIYYVLK